MADLFLSYSPKDTEIAHKVAQSLESKGSSIYYHRLDSVQAEDLQLLDAEMSQASWIIVLWSRNALEDGRITYEAMHAREKNNLLSVQIEPNSIPTEYNNAHSADHVNYQNQLTLIVQQTLAPKAVSASAPVSNPATEQEAPQEGVAEQNSAPNQAAQKTEQSISQPQKRQEEVALQQTVKTETPAPDDNPPLTTASNTQANEAQKAAPTSPPQQHTPVSANQNKTPQSEQTPRENLSQRLAETTQGAAPEQTASIPSHKVGATASNPVIRRDLPQLTPATPTNTAPNSSVPGQDSQTQMASAATAATQGKSSKFVPVALMSVGTLILGAVGGGYWFLANNSPSSAVPKNYKVLEKAKVLTAEPVKVAVIRQQKPKVAKQQEPKTNPTTAAKNDDILNALLASAPPKAVPAVPTAPAPTPQKVAKQVVSMTSAERGAKSISQCLGCHSFKKDQPNKSGPNLYGVMDQLIGSERKFNYSDTLRSMGAIGEVWSREQLDCYLKNPAVCMPGTKMSFSGVKTHKKRNDIIAYLQTLKQ